MGSVITVETDRSITFADDFSDIAPLIAERYLDLVTLQLLRRVSAGFARRITLNSEVDVLHYGINYGYLGLCEYGLATGCEWYDCYYECAVSRFDCEMIRWCRSQGFTLPDNLGRIVLMLNDYRLLVECVACGLKITHFVARLAASKGVLSIIKSADPEVMRDVRVITAAARHGRLNVIKYLASEGSDITESLKIAARYGHLHILKWAHSSGYIICERVEQIAINSRRIYVARWISRIRVRSEVSPEH